MITAAQIKNARQPESIFTRDSIEREYKQLVKQFHPDIGGDTDVFKNLVSLYNLGLSKISSNTWGIISLERSAFSDDAGAVYKRKNHNIQLYFTGTEDRLNLTADFLKQTQSIDDIKRYSNYTHSKEEVVIRTNKQEALVLTLPLTAYHFHSKIITQQFPKGLPDIHLAWIGSRLFEYCALLEHHGFSHCGLNPNTIFIIPENHGIYVTSFYHAGPSGSKLTTISANYKNWYPASTFVKKTRGAFIDIELAKQCLISINKNPIDPKMNKFLKQFHSSAKDCFIEYRELLESLYGKPTFHKLEIQEK